MMWPNSFDLWQKDAFFSAAEEVQESADRMESTYRAWLRERRGRSIPKYLDELCRELQTALGTAKWQLEEFEKAVKLSYRHLDDEHATMRHRQFISAIQNQISHVEAALRESFVEEGRQPFRWVNLDEEDRDDFAAFLSGTSQNMQVAKDECVELTPSMKNTLQEKQSNKRDKVFDVNASCNGNIFSGKKSTKDAISINKDVKFVIEIKTDEASGTSDDMVSQADRTTNIRKPCSSPKLGELKIMIADEDEHRNKLMHTTDGNSKEKGFKPGFWKHKFEEYPQAVRAVHTFNQFLGRIGCFQGQFNSSVQLRSRCSVSITLALMLIMFLIVPFVLYST
ncbi:uncharacterized protein LOC114732244 [Neltuma alba]|uniref:uncharacterized protein LOC114732244 n=1 Tax=Neltuma alba TaxID=207710 RepID=UPI0010A50227|nr:uncharacterized protein LOC114732244 [Prosopis alba]XP_028775375.1 uncharacterized protein LOC114732244 [Prosopis alba]